MQEIYVLTFKLPHRDIPIHFANKEIAEEFLEKFHQIGNGKYIIDFSKLEITLQAFNLYSTLKDIQQGISDEFDNVDAIEEMMERLDKFYNKKKTKKNNSQKGTQFDIPFEK